MLTSKVTNRMRKTRNIYVELRQEMELSCMQWRISCGMCTSRDDMTYIKVRLSINTGNVYTKFILLKKFCIPEILLYLPQACGVWVCWTNTGAVMKFIILGLPKVFEFSLMFIFPPASYCVALFCSSFPDTFTPAWSALLRVVITFAIRQFPPFCTGYFYFRQLLK